MKGDYKFNISRYLNGNNSGRNFSEILQSIGLKFTKRAINVII